MLSFPLKSEQLLTITKLLSRAFQKLISSKWPNIPQNMWTDAQNAAKLSKILQALDHIKLIAYYELYVEAKRKK